MAILGLLQGKLVEVFFCPADLPVPGGVPVGVPLGVPLRVPMGMPVALPVAVPVGVPMGVPGARGRACEHEFLRRSKTYMGYKKKSEENKWREK